MATWTPKKSDVLDELARVILHNYGRGRARVAVDGLPGSGTREFADELVEAIRRAGHAAARTSLDAFLRADGAAPSESLDEVLVIDGERLQRADVIGLWHFSVWLDAGERITAEGEDARYLVECRPQASAGAIIDVTDPEAPRRRFADTC